MVLTITIVDVVQELMSFKKSLIKKALLKQNRHLDEQCVQTFKSKAAVPRHCRQHTSSTTALSSPPSYADIMSYMQDRKSTKPPPEHAMKVCMRVRTGGVCSRPVFQP